MTRIPGRSRLRDAAYRAIWAILPDKLEAVLDLLDRRAAGETPSRNDLRRMGLERRAARGFMVGEEQPGRQIAVLRLHGTIAHHAGWEMDASGGTSTDAFRAAFKGALNNSNVAAIVIDCDSPGGAVEGVAETFEAVFAARGQKDVVAVANAHMHSAAYWICAAADEIVVTPSGLVGDIGVMTVHTSYAEMDRKIGIERTLIKAGAGKGTGFNGAPLSDEDREAIQGNVDAIYTMFVDAVARGRGDSAAAVRNGYGEGRSVDAQTAVSIGLADRVATLEDVLAELGSKLAGPRSALRAETQDEEQPMYSDDGEICPDCGSPMEQDGDEWVCPDCGTRMGAEATEVASIAADAFARVQAAVGSDSPVVITMTGSPGALRAHRRANTTHTDKGPAMLRDGKPSEAAAFDEKAALKSIQEKEAARVKSIRALGSDHQIAAATVDQFIADGLTEDQVRAAILDAKKPAAQAQAKKISVTSVQERSERDLARRGFRTPAEFMTAVMKASRVRDVSGLKDDRLKSLAIQGDEDGDGMLAFALPNEFAPARYRAAVGSDEQGGFDDRYGGFLVPQTQLNQLLQVPVEADPTVTTSVPMATPLVKIPSRVDKNHATSVSGGLTFTRKPETAAATASRMEFEKVVLDATTLMGLAYATEEIITDSPISFAALLDAGFRDQYGAHILMEKLRGLGAPDFMGVKNSPCLVTVSKEGSQAADTVLAANVLKMRARCWGYQNAVWLANHDTFPQLATMTINVKNVAGSENVGGSAVYTPSLVPDRPDMLLGRPIYYTEFADTVGDLGDLILGNWTQYLEGTYQPIQSASSVHARFVNHEQAFKVWVRNAGAPWWKSALTPNKGSNTLSPFVTLEAR